MRWRLLLLVGGLAPLAGCHLAERAVHNSVNEPAMYLDEKHVTHELRAEARKVVRDLRAHQAMSEDFEDGFVDGYADALERGGTPLPPAVPPTKYRRGRFLNPNGHARVYDYFAGFQQGASCAAASGKRQFLTVPVLVADPPPEQQPTVQQVPKEQCAPNANCASPAAPTPVQLPISTPPAAQTPVVQKTTPVPPPAPVKVPTDTELGSPKRPLITAPLVPPPSGPDAPLPVVPLLQRVAPEPSAERPGVVPPQPEPIVVVPPMPEPRNQPK